MGACDVAIGDKRLFCRNGFSVRCAVALVLHSLLLPKAERLCTEGQAVQEAMHLQQSCCVTPNLIRHISYISARPA